MHPLRSVKYILSTVSLTLLLSSSVTVAAEDKSELSLQWLGGPTMLIKFGPLQLLTDPMLGEGERPIKWAILTRCLIWLKALL